MENDQIEHALDESIPDTIKELKAALKASHEARRALLSLTKQAYIQLRQDAKRFLLPKDKELTDTDRKIHLEAELAEQQAAYNELLKMDELLEEKINIVKCLLKY